MRVCCDAQVFDSVCELVQSALDGYHVCLFSYGQTGAGKTFTMTGGPTPEQQGIMPRAVQQVRLPPASSTPAGLHASLGTVVCICRCGQPLRLKYLWLYIV